MSCLHNHIHHSFMLCFIPLIDDYTTDMLVSIVAYPITTVSVFDPMIQFISRLITTLTYIPSSITCFLNFTLSTIPGVCFLYTEYLSEMFGMYIPIYSGLINGIPSPSLFPFLCWIMSSYTPCPWRLFFSACLEILRYLALSVSIRFISSPYYMVHTSERLENKTHGLFVGTLPYIG